MRELDLDLGSGATLHAYDVGAPDPDALTILWHHGSPNIGAPPAPLFETAAELGIRWVGYDRPGYGGSRPSPGRDIASAAAYSSAVADSLGLDSFAVMGHSGGGPHALACAALLPERVRGVISVSGLAPYQPCLDEGMDWFAGMADAGVGSLQAAILGREEREAYERSGADAEMGFNPADEAALEAEWSWFIDVVSPAMAAGPAALIDDDLAAVGPWGFDPAEVAVPALVMHGGHDHVVPPTHGSWLAQRCPGAELWLRPEDGHVSVMYAAADALRWLKEKVE